MTFCSIIVRKSLSVVLTLVFLLTSAPAFSSIATNTLSPELYSGQSRTDIPEGIVQEMRFLSVCYSIAQHFFELQKPKEELYENIFQKFAWHPSVLSEQNIDLHGVLTPGENGGKLRIPFTSRTTGEELWMEMFHSSSFTEAVPDDIQRIGSYVFSIVKAPRSAQTEQRDLKGAKASSDKADEVIRKIIGDGEMVEVVFNNESNQTEAHLIRFGDGYGPFPNVADLYRIKRFDLSLLFTPDEVDFLTSWLKKNSNKIRGEPLKLRLALGRAALNWEGDIEHSNIAHAGVSSNAIYLGSVLFKHMLRQKDGFLIQKILDEDEMRHLRGLDHGTEEDVRNRIELLAPTVTFMEKVLENIDKGDIWWLHGQISDALRQQDDTKLENILIASDSYVVSRGVAPVESGYPVKKAVALLSAEEQNQFARSIFQNGTLMNLTLISDLLLMLMPSFSKGALAKQEPWVRDMREWVRMEWVDRFAPGLKGRSLWQVSPEIWHEAGGLARVMQYHGTAMKEIMSEQNVRFRQIEPHYQNRISADGVAEKFDYREDITHPIKDLGLIDPKLGSFYVEVGGRDVRVEVSRGINDLGLEVYLIRDVQPDGTSFYTHSLYNYRSDDLEQSPSLPSWNEFSIFFSRASLELIRRMENQERIESERQQTEWKAPVVHLNDSQVALVPVYRRIDLDEQLKKNQKDASFEIDPVMKDSIFFFTTHTYGNRRDKQSWEVLDFMGIPDEYKDLFEHKKYVKTRDGRVTEEQCWDMASAGLRTSHGQSGVAWAHTMDVRVWDEWINDPDNERMARLRDLLNHADFTVRMRAIANGDHRESTAIYFREYLKKVAEGVDVDHPSPQEVFEAKKLAKRDLRLERGTFFWGGKDTDEVWVNPLNEDQPVVSYSGRLVWEKAGRGYSSGEGRDSRGAFSDRNILQLIKNGVQVVYYGNVQTKDTGSVALRDGLKGLASVVKELKESSPEEYPGNFIFVPRFSLDQQRMLLAASDMGVHDSYLATEAAGFTEADDAVCGGIVVAPLRSGDYYNDDLGEGLFQAQGKKMDFENLGRGNTLVPESLDSDSYLDIMLRALDLHDPDPEKNKLMHYQATSVLFSRILEARLTAAAYLRAFDSVISERETRRHMRTERDKREEEKKYQSILLEQISQKVTSAGYVNSLTSRLFQGDFEGAIERFYTEGILAVEDNVHRNVTALMNMVLSAYHDDRIPEGVAESFLAELRKSLPLFLNGGHLRSQTIKDLQLIAGQTELVISWTKRGILGAEDLRLTHELSSMVANDKRGKSFLDVRTLPDALGQVKEEGAHGYYWRGTEDIQSKLSDEVVSEAIFDHKAFDMSKGQTVLYLMDHGFLPVPEPIKGMGERMSTIHETLFLQDRLPGSLQSASTGAGHFQDLKMDIKQVTRGRGVQVNVRYDENGEIAEIIAQKIEEGDWAVALPGHVDYMINLGGLRFNDFSIELDERTARGFVSEGRLGKAPDKSVMVAPLAGILSHEGAYLVKRLEVLPEVKWISDPDGLSVRKDLTDFYSELTEEKLGNFIDKLRTSLGKLRSFDISEELPILSVEDIVKSEAPPRKFFAGAVEAINGYTEENELFMKETFTSEDVGPKLYRIPLEFIEAIGIEKVRGVLESFQQFENVYIEIYSLEHPEGFFSEPHNLVIKGMPEELKEHAKRSRANTITIFPVAAKSERMSANKNKRWFGQDFHNSIISPVGHNYDEAGLVRSMILGMRLSEINRLEAGVESSLVMATLRDYAALSGALYQGQRRGALKPEDLVNLARGVGSDFITALNRLIELLPVVPLDVQQVRNVYERTLEVLIRA